MAIVEHNLVNTQENKNPEFSFLDKPQTHGAFVGKIEWLLTLWFKKT